MSFQTAKNFVEQIKARSIDFHKSKFLYITEAQREDLIVGPDDPPFVIFTSDTGKQYIWNPQDQIWETIPTGAPPKIDVVDPQTTDDRSKGFQVGQFWFNSTSDGLFICEDNSIGAAVWTLVAGSTTSNPQPHQEFTVNATIQSTRQINLASTPTLDSESVNYNGSRLAKPSDYIISGNTITFNISFPLTIGDKVYVAYNS